VDKYAPAEAESKPSADSDPLKADLSTGVDEAERVRRRTFGYLYLGLRSSHFLFSLSVFAMHVWVACVSVFVDSDGSAALQLFLFGLMWAAHALIVSLQLPFHSWFTNVSKVAIGLATLVSSQDSALSVQSASECRVRAVGRLQTTDVSVSLLLSLFLCPCPPSFRLTRR